MLFNNLTKQTDDMRKRREQLLRTMKTVEQGIVRSLDNMSKEYNSKKREVAKLQAIVNSFHDLIFICHRDGTVIEYYAGQSTYAPPEQFMFNKLQKVLPPQVGDMFEEALNNASKKPISIRYSLMVDGELKDFEARLSTFNGTGDVIIFIRECIKDDGKL